MFEDLDNFILRVHENSSIWIALLSDAKSYPELIAGGNRNVVREEAAKEIAMHNRSGDLYSSPVELPLSISARKNRPRNLKVSKFDDLSYTFVGNAAAIEERKLPSPRASTTTSTE
jgi:hypothetical protein